jgi:hypothetical protein
MFLFLPHRREKIHEVLFVNILKLFRAVLWSDFPQWWNVLVCAVQDKSP